LVKPDGTDLHNTDFTAGTNNFLHSLFCQCSISLNNTQITPASKLYNYRAYIDILLTYETDAAASHLTNSYWYANSASLLPCDPTAADARAQSNTGFIHRWNRMKQSKEIELYTRIHADICNVPLYLLSNVRLEIKFTKARTSFFQMNKDSDSKVIFKFVDAHLLVKRIRPNRAILAADNETLSKGVLARYNQGRTQDFYICEWIAVSLNRQCRIGNHPQEIDLYHGQEHRIPMYHGHEPLQFWGLRSELLRTVRQR
jgi:hypothetical protein